MAIVADAHLMPSRIPSRTSPNAVASLMLPGVSTMDEGRPRPSTARSTLVVSRLAVSPPRDRRRAWGARKRHGPSGAVTALLAAPASLIGEPGSPTKCDPHGSRTPDLTSWRSPPGRRRAGGRERRATSPESHFARFQQLAERTVRTCITTGPHLMHQPSKRSSSRPPSRSCAAAPARLVCDRGVPGHLRAALRKPCTYEHVCIWCPVLQIDPRQRGRLIEVDAWGPGRGSVSGRRPFNRVLGVVSWTRRWRRLRIESGAVRTGSVPPVTRRQ